MLSQTATNCFENECCSISLDLDIGCLILTWKGLLPSKGFREVHHQALALIRKHKLTKMMGDARRMKTIGSSDSEWVLSYWLPSAAAAGFRYNAIVESDYLFNQDSINSIIQKTDQKHITFRHFKTEDDALFWLKHQ